MVDIIFIFSYLIFFFLKKCHVNSNLIREINKVRLNMFKFSSVLPLSLTSLTFSTTALPTIQNSHFEMQILEMGGARIGLPSAPPLCLFLRRRFRLFSTCTVLSGLCVGSPTVLLLVSMLLKLLEALLIRQPASSRRFCGGPGSFLLLPLFSFFCIFLLFVHRNCSWWWFVPDLDLLILNLDFLGLRFSLQSSDSSVWVSPDVARKGLVHRRSVLAVVVIHVPSELLNLSRLFRCRRWTVLRRLFIDLDFDWIGLVRKDVYGLLFQGDVGP